MPVAIAQGFTVGLLRLSTRKAVNSVYRVLAFSEGPWANPEIPHFSNDEGVSTEGKQGIKDTDKTNLHLVLCCFVSDVLVL